MLLDDSYKLKYKRAVNSTEITLYLGEPEVVQGDKKKLDFFGNNLYQANITNLTNVVKVGIKVQMEHKADVVSYQNTEIGQNRKLSQREEGDFLMKLKGELDEVLQRKVAGQAFGGQGLGRELQQGGFVPHRKLML